MNERMHKQDTQIARRMSGRAHGSQLIAQSRARGAAAVLAMMFLVIFGSLAAAMAIVSQGNLHTAETHLNVQRALSGSETGMRLVMYRIAEAAREVETEDGEITATGNPLTGASANAQDLWLEVRDLLLDQFSGEFHNLPGGEPYITAGTLHLGPISLGAGEPNFEVELTPHPLPGEDYDAAFYQRAPYDDLNNGSGVSNAYPLDARFIRVKVTSAAGKRGGRVYRSLSMDFEMGKRIRFALYSRSRVMIGQNVMIEGPVGSTFGETHLNHGHPVQMQSDFRGISDDLDDALHALTGSLIANDRNGDNRIEVANPYETAGISDPGSLDLNADGYIDEMDMFLAEVDTDADGQVTAIELSSATSTPIHAQQLMELIDTFGDPSREGYGDGVIDEADRYAKVQGALMVTADKDAWEEGAAGGAYQDFLQGPIRSDHGDDPLTFEADLSQFEVGPETFNPDAMETLADGDLAAQALAQAASNDPDDPDSPQPLGGEVTEAVPYGAAHPYDFYTRPVYENMTFTNVKIPKGSNALFKNCTFIGVTFVESEMENDDPNFNYAGMQEADGSAKHPDRVVMIDGTEVADTKTVSNNLRFDGCTFEGAVATSAPKEYTHTRNKIAFTGNTKFEIDDSDHLTEDEKRLYRRSTLLAPQYSIEMGTFVNPSDTGETLELSGTIVAGLIDMRGQIKVNGTIMTTFEPKSETGPVIGETSPQFNTTLGYFSSADGDLEAELPAGGLGVIQVRYDPTIPLPDGISGPIELVPMWGTYREGGR